MRAVVNGDLQQFFGTGMVLRFTMLGDVLLVLVGGIECAGSAQKLMRELGFVVGDLEGTYEIVRRSDSKL